MTFRPVVGGDTVYDPVKKQMKVYTGKEFPLRYPISITEDEYGKLWMGGPVGIGPAEWNISPENLT